MTSTNGQKLTDLLSESTDPGLKSTGEDLLQMIQENSTKDGAPQEITDGIRVLGTPVGNPVYCRNFISEAMKKAQTHATTILERLPSKQSALQLYKFCTSQKMTHLFGADVLTEENHPRN